MVSKIYIATAASNANAHPECFILDHSVTKQENLPKIPDDLLDCAASDCKWHQAAIDSACEKLLTCLYQAGQQCLPQFSKHAKVIPG